MTSGPSQSRTKRRARSSAPSPATDLGATWLAPWARGRGVATRALRLITGWTLETTDIIRLDLYTHTENDASGRVAERAGYVRESVRRAWDLDLEGNPEDAIFYVLIRGDRQPA
jgi:RimJ/RimL family protein N-acetyltransferase